MDLTKIKSDRPDFEGQANVSAWFRTDDNGEKLLIVEIGNEASLGNMATLVLSENQIKKPAE